MKNKTIFLDRDGVINSERGEYTFLPSDFIILGGVAESLKNWSDMGYQLIIISNQGGIGKGIYSHENVLELNRVFIEFCESNGIRLTDFYYCPHHPDFNGKCLCRKPDSLLFEKSIAVHDVDIKQSFMIGDKERDIVAAEKVGIKSFLMEANSSLKKFIPLIP